VRSGADFAAAEIELTEAAIGGAAHDLPVHEIVAGALAGERGAAAVIGQHLIAEIKIHH
jgi:hypothetical protein